MGVAAVGGATATEATWAYASWVGVCKDSKYEEARDVDVGVRGGAAAEVATLLRTTRKGANAEMDGMRRRSFIVVEEDMQY